MKIFVGSSTESVNELLEVSSWIESETTTVVPWKEPGLFMPGANTYSRLVEIAHEVDAAIFIFGEDDHVWYRQDGLMQPRDNVLLEYGVFSGILGPLNTAICRKDTAKIPSDLHGLVVVDISQSNKNAAQKTLIAWVEERKRASGRAVATEMNKGLVLLLTKSASGFTRELSDCIEKDFNAQFPQLKLSVLCAAAQEHIQLGDLIDGLNRRPEVVMITPSPDSTLLVRPTIDLLKHGIPVITIDDQLDPTLFIEEGLVPPVNIACNYADGGKKAAQVILQRLKYKGSVAILSGPKESHSSQVRKLAFIDKVLSGSPNMSIVALRETNWNPEVGARKMEDIINEVDQIDAVFCCNDRLALKAIEVLKSSDRSHGNLPIVVGHDGIRPALEAVRDGDMFATISQHMDQLAIMAVDELQRIFRDKQRYLLKHDLLRHIPTSVITREDLARV